MEKNLTDVFASTLYELANSEFPEEVVREARLCLLDFLGPILGGSAMLKPQLTEYLDLQPATTEGVTLVGMGGRKASLQNGAMVNGMFGHVLELRREYRIPVHGAKIELSDRLTNLAHQSEEYQLLYHCRAQMFNVHRVAAGKMRQISK